MASTVDDLVVSVKHLSQVMCETLERLQRDAPQVADAQQRSDMTHGAAEQCGDLFVRCAELIDALPHDDCYRPGTAALKDELATLQAAHDEQVAVLAVETEKTQAYRDALHARLVASLQPAAEPAADE